MSNNKLVILFAIAMIILCAFILYMHIKTVNGLEYCGFGQRAEDNCINIIPQNQPIPISQIRSLD